MSLFESILSGGNLTFISELYSRYLQNPETVDPSWGKIFDEIGDDLPVLLGEVKGASWTRQKATVIGTGLDTGLEADAQDNSVTTAPKKDVTRAVNGHAPAGLGADVQQAALDSVRALQLIRAYRTRGHLIADLDPLGLYRSDFLPELDPASFGFLPEAYDREVFLDKVLGMERASVRKIISTVRQIYCRTVGVEFTHIQNPEQKSWLQRRIEGGDLASNLSDENRKHIFGSIIRAERFEKFLNIKHPGTKRFGLEGGESTCALIEEALQTASESGVQDVVIGMAHRGRLNILANVMQKPYAAIFSEFQGGTEKLNDVQGSGDVKYHLGTSADREFAGGMMHLSLTANPSHLEAVDPVVIGKARAKMKQLGDATGSQVLPVLLHGDAAFAGQGLVPETLDMALLKGYRVGGVVHIIINNQIGFTTKPTDNRTGPHCTEVAKIVDAPIFHVNGDDPDAVARVAHLAVEFRQKFHRSVIIDMWCYRRHGHNEGDEPAFTQPLMYKAIAETPSVLKKYTKSLVRDGVLTQKDAETRVREFDTLLENAFVAASNYRSNKADWLEGRWSHMKASRDLENARRGETEVNLTKLKKLAQHILSVPDGFNLNSKIARQFKTKLKAIEEDTGIDWAFAEGLAMATLLDEGYAIRLSGQDCGRGTFSQRHASLYDQITEEKYIPLANLSKKQPQAEIIDSPLAELSVLGFEYGYTLAEPNCLVMWEAQFGDFSNGAQIIIDQFIASGESKWLRMSGLVMLLPHGYEGQGPEHSSARPERFLQLCAEDNLQVCNCTTPAQYFHVLRRQLLRSVRKPLILFTPKSLLRHKLCVSKLDKFGPNSSFHRLIGEQMDLPDDTSVRRVVMCSGKVYYDLLAERERLREEEDTAHDIALIRIEQLYPFPYKSLHVELSRYPNLQEVVWCQEEPENMGAWNFVRWRIESELEKMNMTARRPFYSGRTAAASPATGSATVHKAEQEELVARALDSGSFV